MAGIWRYRRGAHLIAAVLIGVLALSAVPVASAAPFDGERERFADERFARVWSRTDSELVRGGRSWYWGPGPWFDYAEFYRQGVNGLRTVQYFDKARMELNNPADRSGPNQGVTNGLLVKELVSGRLQLGDDPFDVDQRAPADVPVAGNPRDANPNAPGYGAFAGVATLDNGYRDPQRLGERIATTIDRSGTIGLRPELATAETEIVQYNTITGHNIPRVFWQFMNQQGPILDEVVRRGPVVDWLFTMGLPITDAYWTRAQIGTGEQDVLVQLFERRVLTYVPGNPPGYKVEMGNVGQHYFQWRYPHLGTPWASPLPDPPLVYASNIDTGSHWELYLPNFFGEGIRITYNTAETVAFSWRRSWDPAQVRLLVDSRRSNPNYRQIYTFDPPAFYSGDFSPNAGVTRLSYSDGTQPPLNGPFPGYLPRRTASDYNASVSPDGTKIIFVSDRDNGQELYLMPFSGNFPVRLTTQGCTNETPTWSPDGRRIYWASNCDGDFELYQADLVYIYDTQNAVNARLDQVTQLTTNDFDDRFARIGPDGRTIAYSINPNGDWDLALYDVNRARRWLLIRGPGNTEAPTWSADGRSLAYAGDTDGDYEIYILDLISGASRQITNNAAQDRWPLWAQ